MKISWDKYETALLIDTYWKIENGEVSRRDAITELSALLRQRAINNGITIDDIFRNENGISCRLAEITYIFTEGKSGFKSPAKLFIEIAELYKNNENEYEKLLFEAYVTNNNLSTKKLFHKWLLINVGNKLTPIYLNAIKEISDFCVSRKILNKALFETTEIDEIKSARNAILSNKVFKFAHRNVFPAVESAVKKYIEFTNEINKISSEFALSLISENEDKKNTCVVDFSEAIDYAYTAPISITMYGEKEIVTNWKSVYVWIVKKLYQKHRDKILSLKRTNINDGKRVDFGSKIQFDEMVSPKEVAPSLFVETNYSATDIVKKIKTLLSICDENGDAILIEYSRENKKTFVSKSQKKYKCDEFRFWLENTNYSKSIVSAYCSVIEEAIETLIASDKEINKSNMLSLAQSLSSGERNNMILRSAINKYIQFLSLQNKQGDNASSQIERDNSSVNTAQSECENNPYKSVDLSDIEVVLHRHFTNGYRFKSLLAKRRFKNLYQQENGNDLSVEDSELENRIVYLCVIVDDMAYLTKDMMPEELKEKIFSYIQKNFDEGKKTIHFESIINEFNDELFETCICNNTNMLKSYLEKTNDDKFYVLYNFVASDPNAKLNSYNEIKNALIEAGVPQTFDDLYHKLPHIQQSKIRTILSANDEFIRNKNQEYFYVSIFHISIENLNQISSYIANAIYNYGYLGDKELISAINKSVFDDNSLLSELGIRDAIGYLLRDKYSFKGKIISSKDETYDMKKVFADFCSNSGNFTLDDLNQLKSDLETSIYFESVYENSIRVSKEQFVPKGSIIFPVEQIDEVLEQFCMGDYLPLKEISTFGLFPYIEYPWNLFLLEHYVSDYSAKFKLLSAGHNANKVAGAIVKKENDFEDFAQVLSDALANSNCELNAGEAFNFFVESGYLATKRFSNIEAVLQKAQKIRNQR